MAFLAIDIGNTRLKWALYASAQPGAAVQAHGAEFLENIDKLADGSWQALPPPQRMLGCCVAADAVKRRVEEQMEELWDVPAHSVVSTASEAGLTNVSFELGRADNYRGKDYGFVTVFDALHDMGDPAAASRHVRWTLAPEGTWMIVEPYAGDRIEENLNPIGRAYYAASTLLCTPCSLSQEGRMGLGAQAGEARLRSVVMGAGFTRFRRATHSPVNLILEARP